MTAESLLSELIRVPTADGQPTGPAIDLVAELLAPAGFHVIHRFTTAPGVEHALLERDGEDPPFLIDGHLDTVPTGEPGRWNTDPLGGATAENAVWGRGACDDKGPLAAAIMALQSVPTRRRALLSLTGDEETDMRGMLGMLEHPAVQSATWAVALEPTGLVPVRAHKGNARIRVEVTGESAHASRPWAGRNAIDDKVRLMTAMADWFAADEGTRRVDPFGEEASTLVVTREVTPNAAYNVIPDQTMFWYNYRPLPGMDRSFDCFLAKLHAQAERQTIHAAGTVEFSVPPFLASAESPLVTLLEKVSSKPSAWVSYGTHAGFLAAPGREVAVFGPGNIAFAHREDEHIDLAELAGGVAILQEFLSQL